MDNWGQSALHRAASVGAHEVLPVSLRFDFISAQFFLFKCYVTLREHRELSLVTWLYFLLLRLAPAAHSAAHTLFQCVKILLDFDADVSVTDAAGATAFEIADEFGQHEVLLFPHLSHMSLFSPHPFSLHLLSDHRCLNNFI